MASSGRKHGWELAFGLSAMVFVFGMVSGLTSFAWDRRKLPTEQLYARGVLTSGHVSFLRRHHYVSKICPLRHMVVYDYLVGGRSYRASSDIDHERFHGLKGGELIDILYLPDDPQVSAAGPRERLTPRSKGLHVGWPIAGAGLFGLLVSRALLRRSPEQNAEDHDEGEGSR